MYDEEEETMPSNWSTEDLGRSPRTLSHRDIVGEKWFQKFTKADDNSAWKIVNEIVAEEALQSYPIMVPNISDARAYCLGAMVLKHPRTLKESLLGRQKVFGVFGDLTSFAVRLPDSYEKAGEMVAGGENWGINADHYSLVLSTEPEQEDETGQKLIDLTLRRCQKWMLHSPEPGEVVLDVEQLPLGLKTVYLIQEVFITPEIKLRTRCAGAETTMRRQWVPIAFTMTAFEVDERGVLGQKKKTLQLENFRGSWLNEAWAKGKLAELVVESRIKKETSARRLDEDSSLDLEEEAEAATKESKHSLSLPRRLIRKLSTPRKSKTSRQSLEQIQIEATTSTSTADTSVYSTVWSSEA